MIILFKKDSLYCDILGYGILDWNVQFSEECVVSISTVEFRGNMILLKVCTHL